jgi:hypothetical protein
MIRYLKTTETKLNKGIDRLLLGRVNKTSHYKLQEFNEDAKKWEDVPTVFLKANYDSNK